MGLGQMLKLTDNTRVLNLGNKIVVEIPKEDIIKMIMANVDDRLKNAINVEFDSTGIKIELLL